MVSRPSTSTALVGVGLALVVVSLVPVGTAAPSVEFVHSVEPADGETLAYGIEYATGDVRDYENLSERGQVVFDRARADSPHVVSNQSATAPDFEYATDQVALGQGVYAVAYDGEVYSLTTQRDSAGYNVAASVVALASTAARVLGIVLAATGVLLAGWRRHAR